MTPKVPKLFKFLKSPFGLVTKFSSIFERRQEIVPEGPEEDAKRLRFFPLFAKPRQRSFRVNQVGHPVGSAKVKA
jgi:hypothetical protein